MFCSFLSGLIIIFCNYCEMVDCVIVFLNEEGILVIGYYGGMEQDEWEKVFIWFRNSSVYYLVFMDLGFCGFDIEVIQYIIYYQFFDMVEFFIYCNG